MGPTGDLVNVIQIHPTRKCNLRCQHCYSTSGPEYDTELAVAPLEAFLADAAREGFNAVGFSGGEPLVYRELPRVLESARKLGFYTTVTTNGLLLNPRTIKPLAPHVNLVALSVDGIPASHDRMRAKPKAFEKMRRNLDHLRAGGVPFGFIFTLTLENLDELSWVAEFAVTEGARLLQIHPLERAGRARDYDLWPPDDLELSFAFMEVARLQRRYGERLTLQLDVADRMLIAQQPCRAFALPEPAAPPDEALPLASFVSPLVVQEDGWIVPVQHGFATAHAIGRLGEEPFALQAARWKRERYARFLELSRGVWDRLRDSPSHLPFTNWYAAITNASVGAKELIPLRAPRRGPPVEAATGAP